MAVYATDEQLAAWTGDPAPETADRLLRAASRLVDDATLTAVYDVGTDGLPKPGPVADALADACCAQVATWIALGIDPTTGLSAEAPKAVVKSKRIGTAAIDYDTTEAALAAQTRATAGRTLTDEARQILAAAGLTSQRVWLYG